MNFIAVLFSGTASIIFLLSVIHTSQIDQFVFISEDFINLTLFPKKPFLDRKNNVPGLDLPNSSNPTIV